MTKPTEACEWCEGAKDCPSFEPQAGRKIGYACTRESGHLGKHVVCLSFRHRVAEWDAARTEADEARP
jgi:hypothetical protein